MTAGADSKGPLQQRQSLYKLSASSRKRKGNENDENPENPSPQTPAQTPVKRQRTFPPENINSSSSCQVTSTGIGGASDHPLQHWVQTGNWRKADFEQTSQVIDDFEKGKAATESSQHDAGQGEEKLLAGAKSVENHGMQAKNQPHDQMREHSVIASIHHSPREANNTRYYNEQYEARLERKGSHMHPPPSGIANASDVLSQKMLNNTYAFPRDTLFRIDLLEETCESVQGNRAMIVRDISPLICPSIQGLRVFDTQHHKYLSESVEETWQSIMEYGGPLPQPAYSVGFKHAAFTQEQLEKLKPFMGQPGSEKPSFFSATPSMLFPFLACEVECGGEDALDIADRRNAQSLSMALKALVILFRLAKRESEIEGQIIGYSISHNHASVRIYGYRFAKTTDNPQKWIYRQPIYHFNIVAVDGQHKWVAYQFTRNVYDYFAPMLRDWICSAIDDLSSPPAANTSDSDAGSSPPDSSDEIDKEEEEDEEEQTPATSFIQACTPPPD